MSGYHRYLSGTEHAAQARYPGFNSLITSKSLYSSMRQNKLIIREAITGAHPSQIFLIIIHDVQIITVKAHAILLQNRTVQWETFEGENIHEFRIFVGVFSIKCWAVASFGTA